jgi:uncharacterized cupin superfamily protein
MLSFVMTAAAADRKEAPTTAVHGDASTLKWGPPEYGGREAILYKSSDGRRTAATFKGVGTQTFTYPFDEFFVVVTGTVHINIKGGESFDLAKGGMAYFHEGTQVEFTMSPDFQVATCQLGNHP